MLRKSIVEYNRVGFESSRFESFLTKSLDDGLPSDEDELNKIVEELMKRLGSLPENQEEETSDSDENQKTEICKVS